MKSDTPAIIAPHFSGYADIFTCVASKDQTTSR